MTADSSSSGRRWDGCRVELSGAEGTSTSGRPGFQSRPAAVVGAALGVGEGGLAALAHLFRRGGLRGLDPKSLLPDFPPLGHRACTDF